ncbi:hypothetical protein F9C07_12043 [Aspergillus flavus]|uniref:Uncharacterized protein n=2 Tax=Aspergillus flavus TaxID=5059 RepID=A0A7U2N2D5_ASPFN|nr:hypothetical protein F9C07_12043 [Aspergillus flavus]
MNRHIFFSPSFPSRSFKAIYIHVEPSAFGLLICAFFYTLLLVTRFLSSVPFEESFFEAIVGFDSDITLYEGYFVQNGT